MIFQAKKDGLYLSHQQKLVLTGFLLQATLKKEIPVASPPTPFYQSTASVTPQLSQEPRMLLKISTEPPLYSLLYRGSNKTSKQFTKNIINNNQGQSSKQGSLISKVKTC